MEVELDDRNTHLKPISPLHLPYICRISRLYLQVELDDFNTHLKPHRTDKLGQLYSFLEALPPLAGLSAFQLHAIGKLAVAHGIGEGQLCLASVPHHPPSTPLGAIPYSRDTVYIIRSGEVTYPSP